MQKKHLISIIIPVYNVEKYLNRCIGSIVNQTYKNLEIILVDDGSPDNCPQICDEWAKKDKRIKVMHIKNSGVSNARNLGLKYATGKYIGFVDSDDYIDKSMYEKMMHQITQTNTKMCFCDINIIELNNKIVPFKFKYKNKISKKELMESILEHNGRNFAVWNKLIDKEILDKIEFDINIYIREDALFVLKVIDKLDEISYLDDNLYYYQMDKKSALHDINIIKKVTLLDATSQIIEILKKNNINSYLNEECNYIGRYYKYKVETKKRKVNIDFEKYEKQIQIYLKNGLLKEKISTKNKIKILLYNLLIRIFDYRKCEYDE